MIQEAYWTRRRPGPCWRRRAPGSRRRFAGYPGGATPAGTVRYALPRWEALTRYVGDGRFEPDNNPVERAMRPLTLGRKNWLFAGSDTGGHRAAAIASLIATARLNGLDPEAYLRDVLGRIADHPVSRVAEFLPWTLLEWTPSDRTRGWGC